VKSAGGLALAKQEGIPTYSFSPKDFSSRKEYELELARVISDSGAEWVICAGYMRILKKTFIDYFPNRILNIHPSLLPSFPGLRAQQQAIDYGVTTSGCTIHLVDYGMDTGPIIMQVSVPVHGEDDERSLSVRILKAEHETYWKAIKKVTENTFKVVDRKVIFA
jgi:phosphoribosylglycinamide formyltransferase-1